MIPWWTLIFPTLAAIIAAGLLYLAVGEARRLSREVVRLRARRDEFRDRARTVEDKLWWARWKHSQAGRKGGLATAAKRKALRDATTAQLNTEAVNQ